MIKDIIEYGTIVGFKVDDKVIRGFLVSHNPVNKEYNIAITHIDGVHHPVKNSDIGYEVGMWSGPILGVV